MISASSEQPQPSGNSELSVLIAEKSEKVRKTIGDVLERLGRFKLVAEAATGPEALELFLLHRPDVAIIAISLPTLNGFEVLERIQRAVPGCAVILTSRQHSPSVESAGALLGAVCVCSLIDGPAQIRRSLQDLLAR